jgi:hypothetical protein
VQLVENSPGTIMVKLFTIDVYPSMAYKATTIEELIAIMKRIQGDKTLTQFAAELDARAIWNLDQPNLVTDSHRYFPRF